jgi:hypothetical protein
MGDGENEHALRVQFERHQVRELVENGLVNRDGSHLRSRPDWRASRRFFESPQDFVDSFDEPIA